MPNRAQRRFVTPYSSILYFLAFVALSGCAAPGEPVPPSIPIPVAITDLAAHQSGSSVTLVFTPPKRSTDGEVLESRPELEIYRDYLPANAAAENARAPKTAIYTVPAALVDTYLTEGRVVFRDPLAAKWMAEHPGEQVVYMVRSDVNRRKESPDSNLAVARVLPVAEPVAGLTARVTQEAVELNWQPPAHGLGGGGLPDLAGYRVYRAEVAPGAETAAEKNPAQARLKSAAELLGPAASTSYRDNAFEFGHTYIYTVRSLAAYPAGSVESDDSAPITVSPRDTFPPAPPAGLVAIGVPAAASEPARIELSWAISPETDLAGYNVYRSNRAGERGERLNHELVLAPTFRDATVAPGRRYWYSVTAVDRSGNESAPGAATEAGLSIEPEKQP